MTRNGATKQTSYSGQNGGGSVVNQVTNTYNGFGQLTGQTQNLGGSPTISGTVDYVYSETNNGTENNSRLQATVYPDGRVVDDNYSPEQSPITGITHSGTTATVTTASADGLSLGQTITVSGATPSAYDGTFVVASIISSTQFTYTMSSTPSSNASGSYMMVAGQALDNVISRPDGLQDHSTGTVLEADTYLGLSTVVQQSHPQTGIDLTYITQSGDPNPPPSYAATGGDRYGGLDQFGRVVDQYYLNLSTPSSPTDDFQYAYDRDGNPLYKDIVNQGTTAAGFSQLYHSNGASESNAYDSLGRVINFAQGALSASGTNGSVLDTVSTASTTQSWSLDALGNWSSFTTNGTAQTRSYNGQNQLTAVSGATTPTYDHDGNMTKDQNGTTYKFDAWNRMVYANTGTANETFGYLAGGQRASIAVSGSAANFSFFNAAWQEVELDNNTGPSGSAAVQDTYVWGLGNISELIARDDASGNRLYVQQDANWDVTALVGKVSGTWQVVERFSYSPYGVATVLTGTWGSATDSYSWVYRYQAGKYDSLSGLYNFRNRDYSPTLGQWLEADQGGYVQGANLYQANLGAPISHVDPYGLAPTTGSAGAGNNAAQPATQPIIINNYAFPVQQTTTVTYGHNQTIPFTDAEANYILSVGIQTLRTDVDSKGLQTTMTLNNGQTIVIHGIFNLGGKAGPQTQPSPLASPAATPPDDSEAAVEAAIDQGLIGVGDAFANGVGSSYTDESGNTVIVVSVNEYGTLAILYSPQDGLYHAVLWNGTQEIIGVFPSPPITPIKITTPTTQPGTGRMQPQ